MLSTVLSSLLGVGFSAAATRIYSPLGTAREH